jgi:transposase
LKYVTDDLGFAGRQAQSLPVLTQLKSWLEKTLPQVTAQNALGKAVNYLASH